MNPTTPPTITLQYLPEQSGRFPWLIAIDGEPLVRMADDFHAMETLKAIPHYLSEGATTPEEAVGLALDDTAAMVWDQWEAAEKWDGAVH